ncbi:hypothetical protein [Maribacter sp. 2307ULW6-5]|uniref:hypothetical protein n=1 Tax=Maribacter sp. 2307ULW6-5 TaxID=3386275 RepID=UPI0039BD350C
MSGCCAVAVITPQSKGYGHTAPQPHLCGKTNNTPKIKGMVVARVCYRYQCYRKQRWKNDGQPLAAASNALASIKNALFL